MSQHGDFTDSTKATGQDYIPVVVLMTLSSELFPVLIKCFNRCLKKKCFPVLYKISTVCLVYKNAGESSSLLQYYPISRLTAIRKILRLSSVRKMIT